MNDYIIPQDSIHVRLVPEICLAARKTKRHKEVALWYCLRAINHWGSGRLPLGEALDSLCELFNYSRTTAYETISKGDGVFWDRRAEKRGSVIEIRGLESVALCLGVTSTSTFYVIPAEQFNTPQLRKAWLYSVLHDCQGREDSKPISRQSIEEATGVMPKTQRRYERLLDVKVLPNYAFEENLGEGDKYIPIKVEVLSVRKGKTKVYIVDKQLGNIYQCPVVATIHGISRKIRKAVRSGGGRALAPRRFFYSATKLIKTTDRDAESFLAIPDRHRRLPGAIRGEWCQCILV